MASATANQVKVNGSLYLPWVLVESNAATRSKFTAMIRVEAPPSSVHSNAPIHLVVVLDLDVCGRMIGQQQQQQEEAGDLLETMKFIKGKLRETEDRIDVVDAFNGLHLNIDTWITFAQAGNRVPTSRRIELKVLVKEAIKHLDEPCSGDDEKRVGFILLLSDGQSNLTESDSRALLSSKYQVHVFGLGINHGDPDPAAAGMLHRIAQGCSGTYSSIARADNLNTSMPLMEAVALCLGGLKSVVAINTRVKIGVKLDPHWDSLMDKDRIEIKVQRPSARDSSKSKKEGFLVGDGFLYAGEVKDLIVDIGFGTTETSSRTRSATLTATVEYVDSSSLSEASTTVNCTLPLLVTGTSNRPALRAYKELEKLLPNSMVLQRMIMFEVLEELVKFAGRLPPPPPTTPTKKTSATKPTTKAPHTPTTGDLLRTMWDNLKKQGKTLQVAQEMGNLVDLRWIDNDMEAMASCLQREGGLSCIYSWVSSYEIQRATTTGLPLPANPFLTPAMEEMVRKAKQSVAPSSLVKNTAEMGKQDDTSAQMEPSPSPSVLLKGAVEMDKQDGADGNQNDEKAKLAIRLMDDLDGRFQLFEDKVTSLNISVSEMSDIDRKVCLELFKGQMHQAAEKAIIQWREWKASSSSSSVVDDQGARPAPA